MSKDAVVKPTLIGAPLLMATSVLVAACGRAHPLYYFSRDTDKDDGQGGHAPDADRYVLAPSGDKADN
jgi:predicted small lipoprotein YifL